MSRPDFLRPLVISGPSGTGKSTLLARLLLAHPNKFGFSVSHTTRAPREREKDGRDYYFVSRETFQNLIQEGAFIEHAQFSGNYYGTSVKTIREVAANGHRCILDIDSQGVRQIKAKKGLEPTPIFLFISPPNMKTLRERLRGRGTESESSIRTRLDTAVKEIEYARTPGAHDVIVVNDDLERAYKAFERVALGESNEEDVLPPLNDRDS